MNLGVIAEFSLKEAITSLSAAAFSGRERSNLVVSTIDGDVRIMRIETVRKPRLVQVSVATGLPPVVALSTGNVTDVGTTDLIVGGLDNALRVISSVERKLVVRDTVQLGSLPTALCVTNVVGNETAEVIVATNDGALRCYGWFEASLDKLAHKTTDRPTFSLQPLRNRGMPYSGLVFGDDSGSLYVYHYADDRLQELSRLTVGGEGHLLATGNITGDKNDDVVIVSDGRALGLLAMGQSKLEMKTGLKLPSEVSSLQVGHLQKDSHLQHIVLSLRDSTILLLSYNGEELIQDASLKTAPKPVESLLALGDFDGDGNTEIVQAIGNNLNLITAVP
ncbi:MAG: hypothetical protein C4K47_07585 [Candidatus Thorarchaeota archaeon]|nr:MAG: hypothetical protein C4K47_07585 [Candidatus Thorarchaeota archaeon]